MGLYPLPTVARLLGVDREAVRRWAFGYTRRGRKYSSAIQTDLPQEEGSQVLTFLELIELLHIRAFLDAGVSWAKVRDAAATAARLLADEPHPFARRQWFADPAALYLKLGTASGDECLVEVAGHAQVALEPALRPYLQQIDFDVDGLAQRWYPLGLTVPVVLDPLRGFGAPITDRSGISTEIIAAHHRAGDSVETIASWFQADVHEIAVALEYESQLAGAARDLSVRQ